MTIPATRSRVLVVRAEDAPRPDTPGTSPCHRYRLPRTSIETRSLDRLADDRIRVEMIYAGICGTDLHLLQTDDATGYVRTSAPASIPSEGRVIGHEGVGRIVATGRNVTWLRPGQVVSFASIIACLQCAVCRRGDFNQCPQSLLLGMQVDGLFGTVVDVPASLARDVSEIAGGDGDLQALACLEPAGVALLACENARVAPGDSVLVFGGGPIGLYCAILCKRVLGASHVTLVEPAERRRLLAGRWCDAVHDVEEYFGQDARQVDVVLEASGSLANIRRVFPRVGANGRVVLLGRSGAPLEIDSVDHMITQAISISGSRGHLGGALAKVMSLYRAGLLPLDAVITQRLGSLDELLASLEHPDRLMREQCKVLARLDRRAGA